MQGIRYYKAFREQFGRMIKRAVSETIRSKEGDIDESMGFARHRRYTI